MSDDVNATEEQWVAALVLSFIEEFPNWQGTDEQFIEQLNRYRKARGTKKKAIEALTILANFEKYFTGAVSH